MKKNALVGLILGILIGVSVAVLAETMTISMTANIVIPSSGVEITVSGLPYVLNEHGEPVEQPPTGPWTLGNITFATSKASTSFTINNRGSTDLTVTFSESSPSALQVRSKYILVDWDPEYEWEWGEGATLPRGKRLKVLLEFEDLGLSPGVHSFDVAVSVSN